MLPWLRASITVSVNEADNLKVLPLTTVLQTGTHRTSFGPLAPRVDLGEGESPSRIPDSGTILVRVAPLCEARTLFGNRRVSGQRGGLDSLSAHGCAGVEWVRRADFLQHLVKQGSPQQAVGPGHAQGALMLEISDIGWDSPRTERVAYRVSYAASKGGDR